MPSLTEENYLKAIYKLSGEHPAGVTTTSLAAALGIRAATVSDMLRRLAAKKLIRHTRYRGVTMTPAGRKLALEIIRKHRLWEVFLVNRLGFGWDEVHPIAEQLEHIRSEELTRRLDKFLGHPRTDPHGDPIPDRNGKLPAGQPTPVSKLAVRATGVVTGVSDHAAAFLRFLQKNSLGLGNTVTVVERIDYDQSLNVRVNGRKVLHISRQVAEHLLVRPHGKQ
jgi:DtxR family Mn-dependent transcriptional regulator